jgi:superfamily II DNA or RNA helicase
VGDIEIMMPHLHIEHPLRPYQLEAVKQLHAGVNAGRNPVFSSPTGTGKTKTAVKFISDRVNFKERIFILTPQVEIFNQWLIEFQHAGLGHITGYINDKGVTGRNKSIYVVMPMSLINILSVLPEKFKPDVIVTDECHRSEAVTWQAIYNFYPQARRVGLTATPERTDGQGLINTYGQIIQTINMQEAIDAGYLVRPLLIVPEVYKLDVPIQNGEFNTQEQAALLGKTRIIGDVIGQYGKVFNGLPVIVACSTHEHAVKMTEAFCAAGWKFEHIHSKLNHHERAGILKRIRSGKINGVCTVMIGVEGLDIPGLYGLIWLRRTMSITIYLQLIGRILRPMPGKKYGIILDPVGNCFIHGRPELPRRWSLIGREDARRAADGQAPKMKICPVCSVMNAESNDTCHICGYSFAEGQPVDGAGRKLPAMVDGDLVLLDDIEFEARAAEDAARMDEERERLRIVGGADGAGNGDGRTGASTDGQPLYITQAKKMDILKTGLEKRRGMFAETLREYL